jgi:hypothetical protein
MPSSPESSAARATVSAPEALELNVDNVTPTFTLSAPVDPETPEAHGVDSTRAFRSRIAA